MTGDPARAAAQRLTVEWAAEYLTIPTEREQHLIAWLLSKLGEDAGEEQLVGHLLRQRWTEVAS